MTPAKRRQTLSKMLVALFGALLGEKYRGRELPGAINNLFSLWADDPDDKKKEMRYAAVSKLIGITVVANSGPWLQYLHATVAPPSMPARMSTPSRV